MKTLLTILILAVAVTTGSRVLAGEVDVIKVLIEPHSSGHFTISATLQHEDTGWKHYANAWEVLDEKGQLIGTRVLYHPHVDEQPFTRSLNLKIPPGVKRVTIRANDLVHGHGGKTITVDVP